MADLPQWLIDLGTYLQDHGYGTLGTSIFFNGLDEISKNCISLDATNGYSAITSLDTSMVMYRPQLGIRLRDVNSGTGWTKINQIYNLLNLLVNKYIGSTRFKRIEAISNPFLVSSSLNEGFIYSVNFYIYIG